MKESRARKPSGCCSIPIPRHRWPPDLNAPGQLAVLLALVSRRIELATSSTLPKIFSQYASFLFDNWLSASEASLVGVTAVGKIGGLRQRRCLAGRRGSGVLEQQFFVAGVDRKPQGCRIQPSAWLDLAWLMPRFGFSVRLLNVLTPA